MEPTEYFNDLKSKLKGADQKTYEAQISLIKEKIIKASKIDQKKFLHRLAFTHEVIKKEQQLYAAGIRIYLLLEDIKKFLPLVTPKNSVKIIELDRYPRPIPDAEMDKIIAAQELDIFDGFFVVFTDFTDNSYETPAEKEMVARNRDPIVFGWFKHQETGLKHDRAYLVADWVDEYCELDFAKLLTEMAKNHVIEHSQDYKQINPADMHYEMNESVEKIIEQSFAEMSQDHRNAFSHIQVKEIEKKKSFWGTLWNSIRE